jgi:hypothetical protein
VIKAVAQKKKLSGESKTRLNEPMVVDKFYNGLNDKFPSYDQKEDILPRSRIYYSAAEYKEWVKIKKYKFLRSQLQM